MSRGNIYYLTVLSLHILFSLFFGSPISQFEYINFVVFVIVVVVVMGQELLGLKLSFSCVSLSP